MQEFLDFFTPLVEQGYEIVHLDISAELSNTFNAARLAAAELEGVYVVDSRMLSTGVGLLAIEGAECRDRGMGAAEIAEHLESLTGKVSTSFVLDTLEFMWKGGRCTGVAALGANLLKLKPGLEMKDGKLGVYKKYRGNIEKVYEQYIRERLEGKSVRPGHIFITESGEIEPEVVERMCALPRSFPAAGRCTTPWPAAPCPPTAAPRPWACCSSRNKDTKELKGKKGLGGLQRGLRRTGCTTPAPAICSTRRRRPLKFCRLNESSLYQKPDPDFPGYKISVFNNQGEGMVIKRRSRVDPTLMDDVEFNAEGVEISRSYEPA